MDTHRNCFPGWEVVRLIGGGSCGKVYEIKKTDDFGGVEHSAMKVISIPATSGEVTSYRDDGYDDASITALFRNQVEDITAEVRMMSKLKGNSNIVSYEDHMVIPHRDDPGWDILIRMELLTSLPNYYKLIQTEQGVDENAVLKLGVDICKALELCGKQSIIHRDIKPQNIFISENGAFKLGDFGIARTADHTTKATKTGTYGYMAPEVYKDETYNASVDIYSLGLVLYWMLNERRTPFQPLPPVVPTFGQNQEALNLRMRGKKLPHPFHGSEELAGIVLKACAYRSEDRFSGPSEMRRALSKLLDEDYVPVLPNRWDRAPDGMDGNDATMTVGPFSRDGGTAGIFGTAQVGGEGTETVGPFSQIAGEKRQRARPGRTPPKELPATSKSKKPLRAGLSLAAAVAAATAALILFLPGKEAHEPVAEESGVKTEETVGLETLSGEWTAWQAALPENINEEEHEIESRTMYRSRNKETKESSKSFLSGWTLYDKTAKSGEYGPWSTWSTTKVSDTADRQVESDTRYRYRDMKTTTTQIPSAYSGWTVTDTSESYGDYGSWSSWSTSSYSSSNTREVESRTQYRYRDRQTTSSSNSSMSGWTQYDKSVSYGAWSDWQDSYIAPSNTLEVDTQGVYTVTARKLVHYCTGNTGGSDTYKTASYKFSENCSYHELGWISQSQINSSFQFDQGTYIYYSGGSKYRCSNTCYRWYAVDHQSEQTGTQYRSRPIYTTYYYEKWGTWSDWTTSSISSNSNRQVETRTQYRYRDRKPVTTYYLQKWGDWSSWSSNQVSNSSTRQVEQQIQYRYREKSDKPTYYFYRWTEWSDYSEKPISPSEDREVETIEQFRYRLKTT